MSEKSGTVHWGTAGWTAESPFGGTLTWTNAGATYSAPLDPILVRNLFTTLATILEAQRLSLLPGEDSSAISLPADLSNGARWAIAGWVPENPFTGHLVWFDENGTEVLRSDLNPILVRDLSIELASIHLAQREALGLPSELDEPAPEASVSLAKPVVSDTERDDLLEDDLLEDDLLEDDLLDEEEEEIDLRRWWVRHPIKACIVAIPLLWITYATIAGALAVG